MTTGARAGDADPAVALLLDAGIAGTPHPSGMLLAHLRGTRDCLARWGCREPLALAGLFHSVYGTELFPLASIDPGDRARVRARIGAEAEALVHLYAVMVRRSLHATLRAGPPYRVVDRRTGAALPLDARQLADLLTLDLANRVEQLPRTSMSLWRMARDRRRWKRAALLLPPAAVAEVRRLYPRRAWVAVAADAAARGLRRLAGGRGG
jgi:hypothetical protein